MRLPVPPPQAIVIFGASGDLTRRKILPALYNLAPEGRLSERCSIVGYARRHRDDEDFREQARRAVGEFSRTPLDEELRKTFSDSLSYMSGPFDDPDCLGPLGEHLERLDATRGTEDPRLYYCATPPSAFPVIVRRLGDCGLAANSRIVIEKPFRRDGESARALNRMIHGRAPR